MKIDQLADACWRKSSRSNGSGGSNCVEVAQLASTVAVRDSKDRHGPCLVFTQQGWDSFITGIRAGAFETASETP